MANTLGPGSGDPNIPRVPADFTIAGVATRLKAGPPLDTDWGADPPPEGTVCADSENGYLWVRMASGEWSFTPLGTESDDYPAGSVTYDVPLITEDLVIGGGSAISRYLTTTTTWNIDIIDPGSAESLTVPFAGAALGDLALASVQYDMGGYDTGALLGCTLTATVEQANAVTVTIYNPTQEEAAFPPLTLRVSCIQH